MTAEDMRAIANANGRAEHEAKAYAYFDQKIMKAAKDGKRRLYFGSCGGYQDGNRYVTKATTHITKEEAIEHYRQLGYTFKHVGVIGGVMQDADEIYICW